MAKDVRKEQLVLLKFERKLMGLAAFWGASSATAAIAAEKIDREATAGAYDSVRAALVHLAEVTTQAHAVLEATAANAGARALEASGGTPKVSVVEMVRSALGLG